MKKGRKLLVIGLDCATPQLMFSSFLDQMPNTKQLVSNGIWGDWESSIPAITVPAWATMTTSRDPGQLGFFGFRNRTDYAYQLKKITTSFDLKEPTVWDILTKQNKSSIIMGVPPSYPPKPLNGAQIGCFLTPGTDGKFTYPDALGAEINEKVGQYIVDVAKFRTEDKNALLKSIYEMTERRFDTVEYLMKNKDWDFFMFVEMGVDRIYHGFWKYHDPTHKKFTGEDHPLRNSIYDYHKYVDERIGKLLQIIDDDTVVAVVSDHGGKKMDGAININDWLIQQGFLTLKTPPPAGETIRLKNADIDWSRTKAWGLGGYYGRVFLNIKGREAEGCVEQHEVEALKNELKERMIAIKDEKGDYLNTQVFFPSEVYQGRNIDQAPDMIVYFGDLHWRSTEDLGHDSIHSFETEIGPDDAVHDTHGIFILYDPKNPGRGRRLNRAQLMDGAPTFLQILGHDPLPQMQGRVLI